MEVDYSQSNFVTGAQEIASLYLLAIFFSSITFGDCFFQFQDSERSLKQVPCHDNSNTIYQQSLKCGFMHNWPVKFSRVNVLRPFYSKPEKFKRNNSVH